MAKKKQKKNKKRAQRPAPDKYDLYQRSVQEPEADVKFLQRLFKKTYGRPARALREDFCGTAYLSCTWAAKHKDNRAWGIDLDPEPLAWGKKNNLSKLDDDARARVTLMEGDVLTARTKSADINAAFNFSFFLFKTRPELLTYFKKARTTLAREGIFVLDAYGGADAQKRQREIREHDGFDYVWDQDLFDPITHDVVNYIDFQFRGRKRMKRAFTYHWRLWSLPEIQELLHEAGFSDVGVYWEGTEEDTDEGNGVFTRRKHAPDDPAWIAYIVAVR
jgi:hypothetical protein